MHDPPYSGDKRGSLLPLLFVLLAVVLAYGNSFSGVFQFDDYTVIVNSNRVHSFASWLRDLPRGIRPLLKLSYMLNWITGAGAPGYHLVNLIIHLSNTVLVFCLVKRLVPEKPHGPFAAAIAAAIFGLHPLQTEAVTYICGRSTSLMTLFYLSGLVVHLQGRETGRPFLVHALSPLLFLAALLVKETAVTYPLALLLLETAQRQSTPADSLRTTMVSWVLLLAGLLALLAHPRHGSLLEYSFDIRTMGTNLLAQINAITYLLSRLFVLAGMNIDPDLPQQPPADTLLAAKVIFMGVFAAAGVLLLRRRPWAGFGILWFLLHLAPTNSFVPRLDIVNDRQAYLPLAGIAAICGCTAAVLLSKWRRPTTAVLIFILCLLALFTSLRNRQYHSEIALWEDAARKSPRKARVYNNLGYAYALAGRKIEAATAYRSAMALDPRDPRPRNNLENLAQ